MRWSMPDMYKVTHDCTRDIMLAGRTYYNAMVHIMDYCMATPERGLAITPHGDWYGISIDYKFEVTVKMDSNYTKCFDTRRSITRSVVYLNGASVIFRSSTQKMVSLSTTKMKQLWVCKMHCL